MNADLNENRRCEGDIMSYPDLDIGLTEEDSAGENLCISTVREHSTRVRSFSKRW